MAKTIGRLKDGVNTGPINFVGGKALLIGDLVTIELPPGLRVIGNCGKCKIKAKRNDEGVYCFEMVNNKGCGLWKPKKGGARYAD